MRVPEIILGVAAGMLLRDAIRSVFLGVIATRGERIRIYGDESRIVRLFKVALGCL